MEVQKIKILFFSSGDFGIDTLDLLILNNKIEILKIFTKEAKKQNRGHKLQDNIIYKKAIELGFNAKDIICLNSFQDNKKINHLIQEVEVDFIVVVSYGLLIPEWILQIPKFKAINIHPSRLPFYRGAMPIERAIENGDEEVDLSIIEVTKELDVGNIFAKQVYSIKNKHCDEIYFDISHKAAILLEKTIFDIYFNPQNKGFAQDEFIGLTYASKLSKEELKINWREDCETIYNKIRAFNMHGGMYFIYDNKKIKILNASFVKNKESFVGLVKNGKNFYFQCNNGILIPNIIQPEGKIRMNVKEVLHSFNLSKIVYN